MKTNDTPEFGTVQTTMVAGDVTTEVTKHYQKHRLSLERRRIEVRKKVCSVDEAIEKMVEQAEQASKDDTKVDPSWRLEGKSVYSQRGYFYVIFGYTNIVTMK